MDITPQKLHEKMQRSESRNFRLVDVREEDEYAICKLQGSELLPLGQLMELAPRLLRDKDEPIIVYCHHGMRSQRAAGQLRAVGYADVTNLSGGIEEWAVQVEPGMARY